jgi:hypothetical protein
MMDGKAQELGTKRLLNILGICGICSLMMRVLPVDF